MEPVKKRFDAETANKIIASVLLLSFMIAVIVLSWAASPDPLGDVIVRSVPIVLIFAGLIAITAAGATKASRSVVLIFLVIMSPVLEFILGETEWAVAYLLIAAVVLFDLLVSLQGCKSPMEMNARESFVTFVWLFGAAFIIGFVFEVVNETILHLWIVSSMVGFYPMISVFGVNLTIVFNWMIVGILLFEFMLFVHMATRRAKQGKNFTCSLT